jgi:predicted phosphodiesterase
MAGAAAASAEQFLDMSRSDAPTSPVHQRTLILSDLHLGRPDGARSARSFEALVADFDRVIVNGDAAELHHARFQRDAEVELELFRDLCLTRGIRLDLVAGNHDAFISDVRALQLADGAVYVTHGDAFHPAIAPWSPYAASMRRSYAEALAATKPGTPEDEARFAAAREASLAEWRTMGEGAHVSTIANMAIRPHRVLAVLAYWARFPAIAAGWAERFAPQAGTMIVGHSHRAFVKSIGGLRIVNTGSFGFPGTPHAVVLDGTSVRVHRIVDPAPHYRLAPTPIASWTIAHHAGRARAQPARSTEDESDATGAASTPAMNRAATPSAVRSMDVE